MDEKITIDLNPALPALPKFSDKTKVDVRYPVILPYAFVHIYWSNELTELIYEVEEPVLSAEEKDILKKISDGMKEVVNVNILIEKNEQALIDYIDKTSKLIISELGISIEEYSFKKIFYYIYRDFIGLNQVEPLIRDYFLEDIECNGIETPIYIVHRVYKNLRTNVRFNDVEEAANFVEKLAQRCGRYISYASPILDGSLPGGERVNATYTKDITSRGPTFCFKRGYVQLNDGRIKEVAQLFDESKIKYSSVIEDGNEVVYPVNLLCCGVDERTLNQQDSIIKSVIKVNPPPKLVKVEFEDGFSAEVTSEHVFHVINEDLKIVKAEELKSGMYVPIPQKLEISGYRQKINRYNLIKDFSYSHRICLATTSKIKQIVEEEVALNNKYGNYRQVLANKYGVSQFYFYEIINKGSSISFNILDKLCQERKLSLQDFDELAIIVYGGGSKDRQKAIKIPNEITEELAYLAGALISDGHISKNSIDFSCYEEGFNKAIRETLLRLFGRYDRYYQGNRVYLCNSFIPFFFSEVFGIPSGKKANIVGIPEAIFKSDDKAICAFIRGLFDGDGTASAGLSYKTYSRKLAEELTYLLARIGIFSYLREEKEGFRVNIPSPYYSIYMEKIGFNCETKKIKLQQLIGKQVEHKTNIRHNRIPGTSILSLMKKTGIFKKRLMKKLDFSFNRLYYTTFSRTFARALIEEIKKRDSGKYFEKEISLIEWMLNSKQEFVKIKEVRMIENQEPVYDIELEPCKFFIAGNKPINMFDTIRKFTKTPWTPIQLMNSNTLSPEMLAYLWLLVEYKMNLLIAGGTASGKTTLLNAAAFFIPPEARIVSIEDTRELNLPKENWLPSVARGAIGMSGIGEVDLFSLLKNSFRQNPDYVIVGEVRGKEAFVLFQGMASGHASISTMHADSVDTLIKRLETPPIELSPTLVNTLDAVAIMTHAIVGKQSTRRLREIVEIISVNPDGIALTNTPFIWNPADDKFYFKKESKVFDKIIIRYGITKERLMKEFALRTRIIYELYKRKIFGFDEVQKIVTEYYKKPEAVLEKLGISVE